MSIRAKLIVSCVAALLGVGCGDDSSDGGGDGNGHEHDGGDGHAHELEQALLVAHEGSLVSYDIATGEERPGAVQQVAGPTDMQVTDDGVLLVNLTSRDEILVVDPHDMLEIDRIASSAKTGTRPVHSFITPEHDGKTYWVTFNDGEDGDVASNSARFVDLTKGSDTYLEAVGEIALGAGHHKGAFSATKSRVVITNIADCDTVLAVFDYSDVKKIEKVASVNAEDLGWDGSSFPKTCDPTYQMGLPPAPHGCATSKVSGKAYCNVTSSGEIVAIDLDADEPTFERIPTKGAAGGYTKAHHDGRYVYSLQGEPRDGGEGADCQIGQLVVIDAENDEVVKELALGYTGPGCKKKLTGTDEETAEPAHATISKDGKTLFITTAGGYMVDDARVRQELVIDISSPAAPVQKASVEVGTSSGYHGSTLSGDGKWLFVANNQDGTVTQIDVAKLAVAKTLEVKDKPSVLATYGSSEGPSAQTGPIH